MAIERKESGHFMATKVISHTSRTDKNCITLPNGQIHFLVADGKMFNHILYVNPFFKV